MTLLPPSRLALFVSSIFLLSTVVRPSEDILSRDNFTAWKLKFNKAYPSIEEEMKREAVWMENHEFIKRHNSQPSVSSYTLGHNHFSDLSNTEYKQRNSLGEYRSTDFTSSFESIRNNELGTVHAEFVANKRKLDGDVPDHVDWREYGAVTEVKNQGSCGGCWAFSTTGAIEGKKFIDMGKLVSLSEQELLDCDHWDDGCDGGVMNNAFRFTKGKGGICSEVDYPFIEVEHDRCMKSSCTAIPGTVVLHIANVRKGDSRGLLTLLARQPVSVAIESDKLEFQFYSSGIFDLETCGDVLDHAVLAVGYGTDKTTGLDYWIVKNSWGAMWGESGYIRLARNSTEGLDTCGVLGMCSAPSILSTRTMT